MEFDDIYIFPKYCMKKVLQASGGVLNDEMFLGGAVWFPIRTRFRLGWGEFGSFVSCPARRLNSSSGGQAGSRQYGTDP